MKDNLVENKDVNRVVATVGTFDGVHRGHQAVLATLDALAASSGCEPLVFTFDRHPLSVVAPARAPKMLMEADERDAMLAKGARRVIRMDFNRSLASLSAAEWMRKIKDEYGVITLVLGYDNTFGRDGISLDIADYKKIGRDLGIDVEEAPKVDGCSSSAIRKALQHGDVEHAAEMLGRPHILSGVVEHGRGVGRTIGVPTANIAVPQDIQLPASGVYAGRLYTGGCDARRGDAGHAAVVNVGFRPTFGSNGALSVEAHLPGYDGNLYGRRVRLAITKHIRNERRFESVEALRNQIEADIQDALR